MGVILGCHNEGGT